MAQEIELLPPLAMSTSITADQIRQDRALDKVLQCRHGRPEAALVATADQACIGHHLYGEYVPGVEYALRVHSQSRHGHAQQIRAGRDNLQWHVVNSLGHSQSLPVVDAQAREENLLASATICSDVSTELNGQEQTSGCLTA